MALVAIVGVIAVAAVLRRRWRHPRRRPWGDEAPIANVGHAASSVVFGAVRRRYRVLIGVEIALLATIGVASTVLAMRPLADQQRGDETLNRDVMLCLDVSGSMRALDESILRTFGGIAAGLPGDRIGLTIWNGAAITVFPLTEDAGYIRATLAYAVEEFDRGGRSLIEGTEYGGSSLIGDGLASCVMRFDRLDEERARSIVLATDNKLAGEPIVSLDDAAAFAAERDIRVYAVAPAQFMSIRDARELEEAVRSTGGAYLTTDDVGVVDHVVERIGELEAAHLERPAELVLDDQPRDWAAMSLIGAGLLAVMAWKLRR